jgi:Helix-turn-helix domain
MNTEQYPLTIAAVAERLGITVRGVRWHIHEKKDLRATKLGNLMVIDPQEFARFEAQFERGARR